MLLGARFRPGIEVMLDVLGFAPALERASLVITGEGSLDEQTLHGKAPAGWPRRRGPRGGPWSRCAVGWPCRRRRCCGPGSPGPTP
ncbi:glycerate kinase [Streptomyces tricolor]|nr:glycerate kinase [Streptomyces tricolor]